MTADEQRMSAMTSSAAQRVYEQIVEWLISDELPSGSWLRERSLADSLGVSRTPVREALGRLGSEGLVRLEHHRGAQVVGWDQDEIVEIYGLRAAVEGYVAALAAEKIDADALAALEDNLAAYTELVNAEQSSITEIARLNNEFHAQIMDVIGNEHLASLLTSVFGLPLVRRTFLRYTNTDLHRSVQHHRELIEAFRARDSEAAEMVMKVHIRTAQRAVLAHEASADRRAD